MAHSTDQVGSPSPSAGAQPAPFNSALFPFRLRAPCSYYAVGSSANSDHWPSAIRAVLRVANSTQSPYYRAKTFIRK